MKANSANWAYARKLAQKKANDFKGNYYIFQEWNGSLTVDVDYPKDGTEFEIFKPNKLAIE